MTPKLDMGRAWNDAVALLSANLQVVMIVSGVFFLLPNLAMSLLAPQPPANPQPRAGGEVDPQQVFAQVSAELGNWFAEVWWMFLLVGLLQAVGTLALLALLTDRARPTVGEALGFGVKALPSYFATQIIFSLALVALIGVVVLAAQAVPALGALLGIAVLMFAAYASIKLLLVSPVIGIERQLNPLAAMQRSWRLSKGNSMLILAFFLLLMVAILVVSLVMGLVFGAFSLLGEDIGLIATSLGSGLMSMVMVAVMVAVLAAIHRQLAGAGGPELGQTFG